MPLAVVRSRLRYRPRRARLQMRCLSIRMCGSEMAWMPRRRPAGPHLLAGHVRPVREADGLPHGGVRAGWPSRRHEGDVAGLALGSLSCVASVAELHRRRGGLLPQEIRKRLDMPCPARPRGVAAGPHLPVDGPQREPPGVELADERDGGLLPFVRLEPPR